MKNLTKRVFLLILITLMAGCKTAAVNVIGSSIHAGLQAWVDAPLDGTVLVYPVQYTLVCHGTDPSGVQALEFSADEQVLTVQPNPDPRETLFNASTLWEPATAGTYTIRCRTQNEAGDWSGYSSVRVSVVQATQPPTVTYTPAITFTPTTIHTPAIIYTSTATPVPTLVPTVTSTTTSTPTPTTAALTFTSQISTSTFEYQRDCVPNPGEVTITANLTGAEGVKYLYLFFRLDSSDKGVTTGWNNGVAMNHGSGGEFRSTISWRDIPQLSQVMGSSATFVYQFVAVGENNDNLGRSQLYRDVTISPCN